MRRPAGGTSDASCGQGDRPQNKPRKGERGEIGSNRGIDPASESKPTTPVLVPRSGGRKVPGPDAGQLGPAGKRARDAVELRQCSENQARRGLQCTMTATK